MSDDVIGTSLEDDGPATLPDAPEAAPAPAEPAPGPDAPPDDTAPAEVEAVEVAGKKYVPLGGIISERKQRQAAERQLQEAVARVQALEQQYGQIAPYAQILKDNPQLLTPRQEAPPAPAEPTVDPDLVELAQTLDLYDPATGQPDVKKAAKLAHVFEKRADLKAQSAVQPFQQQALQAQVAANYMDAVNAKLPNGEPVNRAVLDDLWRMAASEPGGLKTLSDRRSVMALVLMASGAAAFAQTPKATPPPPALETEGSGGNPRTRPVMSQLEERIAADKGIAPSKWAERTKGYQKGVSNALED